jgi:SMC interacting uncharacterized protein involved in chromosome segregation
MSLENLEKQLEEKSREFDRELQIINDRITPLRVAVNELHKKIDQHIKKQEERYVDLLNHYNDLVREVDSQLASCHHKDELNPTQHGIWSRVYSPPKEDIL